MKKKNSKKFKYLFGVCSSNKNVHLLHKEIRYNSQKNSTEKNEEKEKTLEEQVEEMLQELRNQNQVKCAN